MEEIQVEIDQHGNVQIEVSGAEGGKCLDLTKHMDSCWAAKSARENSPGNIISRKQSTRMKKFPIKKITIFFLDKYRLSVITRSSYSRVDLSGYKIAPKITYIF